VQYVTREVPLTLSAISLTAGPRALLLLRVMAPGTTSHQQLGYSTAQHSTAQHSTAQHSTAQHSTAQHSTLAVVKHQVINGTSSDLGQPDDRCAAHRGTDHHASSTAHALHFLAVIKFATVSQQHMTHVLVTHRHGVVGKVQARYNPLQDPQRPPLPTTTSSTACCCCCRGCCCCGGCRGL
jgi:hypothetical protein